MLISVTQEHIDNGNQASDFACAIALAFAAAGFTASIGLGEVSFYNGRELLGTLPLPADARFWNNLLDLGRKVDPFTFEMPELDNLQSAIGNQQFVPVPVV